MKTCVLTWLVVDFIDLITVWLKDKHGKTDSDGGLLFGANFFGGYTGRLYGSFHDLLCTGAASCYSLYLLCFDACLIPLLSRVTGGFWRNCFLAAKCFHCPLGNTMKFLPVTIFCPFTFTLASFTSSPQISLLEGWWEHWTLQSRCTHWNYRAAAVWGFSVILMTQMEGRCVGIG